MRLLHLKLGGSAADHSTSCQLVTQYLAFPIDEVGISAALALIGLLAGARLVVRPARWFPAVRVEDDMEAGRRDDDRDVLQWAHVHG
jgi:hypothetical protein